MNREPKPECDFGVMVNTKLEYITKQLEKINGRMWRLIWIVVAIAAAATIKDFF
ncbi:hypothetical protein LCGC14_0611410 [marine sediment metagenome]|uniref:Uncharacterized protein n=1 Tax=marine sediment metagenome TaxID=412755 RepID=A0A0F9RCC0_9ZZZZ